MVIRGKHGISHGLFVKFAQGNHVKTMEEERMNDAKST